MIRAGAAVSRDTSVRPERTKRRYVSGFRTSRANTTREGLIAAAMKHMRACNFRPAVVEIERDAGAYRGAVDHHFGALHLLMRVIARERWVEIVPLLPFELQDLGQPEKAAVWAVLVGKPEP